MSTAPKVYSDAEIAALLTNADVWTSLLDRRGGHKSADDLPTQLAAALRQMQMKRNEAQEAAWDAAIAYGADKRLSELEAKLDEAAAREAALREALEVIATGSPGRVRSWLISHGYADADSFVEPEYLEAVDVARNILANPSTAAQALAERLKAADKLASKASIVGAVAHIHHWQDELQDLAFAYRRAGQAHKEA